MDFGKAMNRGDTLVLQHVLWPGHGDETTGPSSGPVT
jgi:hypothetical protein